MMGSKYRFSSGLALFPVNHSTPVMNITMDHDSISNRVRVRRGKKRRARNPTMATTNAASKPSTGHTCVDQRARPHEHQGGERQTQDFDGPGTAHGLPWNRAAAETEPAPREVGTFNSWSARFTSASRCSSGASAGAGRAGRLRIALQLDVGGDAAMIDRYSRRRVIKRGRQLDGAVAGQGE